MKALLFCAGLGTRLRPITNEIPKALVPVNGKTLLQRNIEYLKSFGCHDFVINIHHFGDKILEVLEENNNFGVNIEVSDETDFVLETGGGLKKARTLLESEEYFVVMNVDILTDFDLTKLIAAHKENDALATLAVTERESSRNLLFDENGVLCGWRNNKTGELKISRDKENLIGKAFSGIHVISPKIFDLLSEEGKFSIIDPYLRLARTETLIGFDHTGGTLIDVGKHETLKLAEKVFKQNVFNMTQKTPNESLTILTNIILPSETNKLGNIFGGELLSRMDRAASIAARRHSGIETVVTASVNHVSFNKPIPMGKILKIEAKVSRAFNTSVEVFIDVFMEDSLTGTCTKTNEGIYTFVAVDAKGNPIRVPELIPETELEINRHNEALIRRELSLVLSGRRSLKNASVIKEYFSRELNVDIPDLSEKQE